MGVGGGWGGGGGGGGVVEQGSGAKTEKTNSSYKVTEGGREFFQCTKSAL